MKSELQLILNKINNLTTYSEENLNEYAGLVRLTSDKLSILQQEDKNPMLDAWLNMGIEEIRKELNNRLRVDFTTLSPEKQKTEFMYSRSTVSLALTNIIMHLS